MKSSKLTIILLLANLGLVVMVVYLSRALRGLQRDAPPVPARVVVAAPAPAPKPEAITTANTNDFHWAQLESEDYRTYIEGLRAVGCPEQTIRDIIIADVDRLLAPQLHSFVPRREELDYWHPEEQELWHNFDHRQWLRQQRQIDHEKREVIRELLGADLVGERMYLLGQEDYYGRRLGFLSEDKRALVRMTIEKHGDREMALREKEWEDGEALTPEERDELRRIRESRKKEIAALLTPEELRRYELWLSPTANAVRNSVYGMDATEDEFLTIYNLRREFDETWNWDEIDLSTPAAQKVWEVARNELDEQIREHLGEERWADYVRAQDADFRQWNATAARHNLPRETAEELYEYKRIVQDERRRLVSNYALSQEQKQVALDEMAAETQRVIRDVLGDRAFNHYLRHAGADWIYQ